MSSIQTNQSSVDKEQEIKNAQMIAQIHFNNWARATRKQFENKK